MSDYGDVNDFQSAKNQIHFKENIAEEPSEIKSNSSGSGGHLVSSRMPGASSAGMVSYKITGGFETLYLRLFASNLNFGIEGNSSNSAILDNDASIDKSNYDSLKESGKQRDTRSFNGGTLKVTSQIGQVDDATATFTITFEE